MITKIRYVRLNIRRSELHTVEVAVPAWEVPIIEAMHGKPDEGETAVTVLGDTLIEKKPPRPADEYTRLANRYKDAKNDDGSKSLPYVSAVYGQFGVGQGALASAIRAATVELSDAEALADLLGDVNVSAGG